MDGNYRLIAGVVALCAAACFGQATETETVRPKREWIVKGRRVDVAVSSRPNTWWAVVEGANLVAVGYGGKTWTRKDLLEYGSLQALKANLTRRGIDITDDRIAELEKRQPNRGVEK